MAEEEKGKAAGDVTEEVAAAEGENGEQVFTGYRKGGKKGKGKGQGSKYRNFAQYCLHLGIDMDEPLDLMETVNSLWEACLNLQEESEMEMAWVKVKLARRQANAVPVEVMDDGEAEEMDGQQVTATVTEEEEWKTKKPQQKKIKLHERMAARGMPFVDEAKEEKQERKLKLLNRVVDILRDQPENTMEATVLLKDSQVREYRVGIFQHFGKWVSTHFPTYFETERIPGKTQFWVRLIDPTCAGIDLADEQNVHPPKRQRII